MNHLARSVASRSMPVGNASITRHIISSRVMYHRAMTNSSSSSSLGTVLTFLSPSTAYSRSAVEFLNASLGLIPINNSTSKNMRDSLDNLHFGSGGQEKWHSTASYCQTSGTILHFLSLSTNDNNNDTQDKENMAPLQLISIHGLGSIADCRQSLANTIQSKQYTIETRLRGIIFNLMNKLGKQITPAWILADNPTTSHVSPILDLTNHSKDNCVTIDDESNGSIGKLRELVLPFFPEESSLQSTLSKSSLARPLPGLYQCSAVASTDESKNTIANNGLIFRPLPAAEEDLTLSKPSLVFQCQHLTDSQKLIEEKGGKTHKIGWRGHGKLGSLMVQHPSLSGLGIRLVQSTTDGWMPTAAFDESTESLLAGSLDELQSSHVNSDGNVSDDSLVKDEKIGNGDCWIEVRSNVQQPLGFIKQFKSQKKQTIAKPPDLPFE